MAQDADGERLEGGSQTEVRRLGDVVIRQRGRQSETVIRLLGHLGDRGFEAAPRPVDGGFTIDGDEQLTYIEGSSPNRWRGTTRPRGTSVVSSANFTTPLQTSTAGPCRRGAPGLHAPCPAAVR